jgi:transposase InsO family protein
LGNILQVSTNRNRSKKKKIKIIRGRYNHSDQGSVYRSFDHNKLAKRLKFTPSISRKANCWDNVVTESFFSQFKTEFSCSFEVKLSSFKQGIKGFVHYYNDKRIQQKLGFVYPKIVSMSYFKSVHLLGA